MPDRGLPRPDAGDSLADLLNLLLAAHDGHPSRVLHPHSNDHYLVALPFEGAGRALKSGVGLSTAYHLGAVRAFVSRCRVCSHEFPTVYL